jgi:hypothetical protein
MLTRPFASEYYYWSVVIILRNLVIAVLSIIFVSVPLYQSCTTFAILCLAVVVQVRRRPYRDGTGMNGLEVTSLGVASILLFLGILFFAELGDLAAAGTMLSVISALLISCFLALLVKLAYQHITTLWPDWYECLLRLPHLLPLRTNAQSPPSADSSSSQTEGNSVELAKSKSIPPLTPTSSTSLLSTPERKENASDSSYVFPAPRVVISPRWTKSIEPSRCLNPAFEALSEASTNDMYLDSEITSSFAPINDQWIYLNTTAHQPVDDINTNNNNWTISPNTHLTSAKPGTTSANHLLSRWAAIARHVAAHKHAMASSDVSNAPSYVIMPNRTIPIPTTTATTTIESNDPLVCPPIFRLARSTEGFLSSSSSSDDITESVETPIGSQLNQSLEDIPLRDLRHRRPSLSSVSSLPSFSHFPHHIDYQ